MSAGARESPTLLEESLLLPIRAAAHIFNAPAVDPLSPGLPEVLGVSGAEYLLNRLQTHRKVDPRTVVLALPEDQVVDGLDHRTQQAFRRFAEHRIQQQQATLRETRRRGWRATGVALILLAFFLSLGSLFGSEVTVAFPSLIRRTLEFGFEITGWVMLWHPIELLVFEPFTLKDRIAALQKLMALRVVVRSWKECGIRDEQ